MKGYAICTLERSGSNYLGQILSSTGHLGHPLEYFNGGGRRMFEDPSYPDDPRLQIGHVLSRGATANGVYGLKVFPRHLDRIRRHVSWSKVLPGLNFVYLSRLDVLGQAISQSRARQTLQWRSHLNEKGPPVYNAVDLSECIRSIVVGRARWEAFFAHNGLAPLRIYYEDVVGAAQDVIDAIADQMGLERPRINLSQVDLRIQRDGLTDEWRARYVAETGDLDRLPEI